MTYNPRLTAKGWFAPYEEFWAAELNEIRPLDSLIHQLSQDGKMSEKMLQQNKTNLVLRRKVSREERTLRVIVHTDASIILPSPFVIKFTEEKNIFYSNKMCAKSSEK